MKFHEHLAKDMVLLALGARDREGPLREKIGDLILGQEEAGSDG